MKIQPVPPENFPCYLEIGAGKMPVTVNPTSSYGLSSWSFDESAPFVEIGSTVFACDWLLSLAIRAAPALERS
jgi:hypothetical protein